LFSLPLSALSLALPMTLSTFRGFSASPLAFGGLPTLHLAFALRILAESLVPALWTITITAALTQTNSLARLSIWAKTE